MSVRSAFRNCAAMSFLAGPGLAAATRHAVLKPVPSPGHRSPGAGLAYPAADTCFVSANQTIIYRIDGWVTGNEQYVSLLDPAKSCSNSYPFTVTAINMPMYFAAATPLTVSVGLQSVDSVTVPGCKAPGVLTAMSSDYNLQVPTGGGLFDIWIPLDTPVFVNGPFFAGFFLNSAVDSAAGAAILIDTFPALCSSYNIWDTTVGFVDLCKNQYFNFPGRLAMEASGIPGRCCAGMTGNIDCDPGNIIDIADLARLIDYTYISMLPLCCPAAANTDGSTDSVIDISDLARLIDYLYISYTPPAACQ